MSVTSDLNQNQNMSTNFVKKPKYKFPKNLPDGSISVYADRQTEIKLTAAFHYCSANML
jgi:hypothetical protein